MKNIDKFNNMYIDKYSKKQEVTIDLLLEITTILYKMNIDNKELQDDIKKVHLKILKKILNNKKKECK